MNVISLLKEGSEKLAKFGWIKNDIGNELRGYCAIGCLGVGRYVGTPLIVEAMRYLDSEVPNAGFPIDWGPGQDIITYNNDPATSYEDIQLVFKRAIQKAEEDAS